MTTIRERMLAILEAKIDEPGHKSNYYKFLSGMNPGFKEGNRVARRAARDDEKRQMKPNVLRKGKALALTKQKIRNRIDQMREVNPKLPK